MLKQKKKEKQIHLNAKKDKLSGKYTMEKLNKCN